MRDNIRIVTNISDKNVKIKRLGRVYVLEPGEARPIPTADFLGGGGLRMKRRNILKAERPSRQVLAEVDIPVADVAETEGELTDKSANELREIGAELGLEFKPVGEKKVDMIAAIEVAQKEKGE
jgi:hypothetical protein